VSRTYRTNLGPDRIDINRAVLRSAMRRSLLATFAVVALAAATFPAADAGARTPTLGFADPLFVSSDPGLRGLWLKRSVDAGAGIARLTVSWRAIAPQMPPAGFRPAAPDEPAYDFALLDADVHDATAHGLKVLFTVVSAPDWAEGPGRPGGAEPGTWDPSPSAYGAFASALAARYSGAFPDPAQPGSMLPRVRYFQAWNEPNLHDFLNPQWRGSHPASPGIYRSLLNAFYKGVKSEQPSALVVTGGTAPYGDSGHGGRMRPVLFLRTLVCLHGSRLRAGHCPSKPHFDILAHNPIDAFSPHTHAPFANDVSTPDIGKLTRVLRRARQAGTVRPGAAKPIWATELWWESKPPDRTGVPLRRQARWYREAIKLLGREGVRVAILLQVRDAAPLPSFRQSTQAGLFFLDGRAKPAFRAVRSLYR
jgi:hypothetical protein